jgi:2,3-dihydroxybenzoate-AMP ligase
MAMQIQRGTTRDGPEKILDGCVPWPPAYAAAYRDKRYWEGLGIADVFERLAIEHPDREAVFDGALRTSFGDLWEASGRLALGFVRLGFKPLDRVIFQLPNSTEFIISFLALMRIGVIPVMALTPHRRTEILHFALASRAVGVLIPGTLRDFDYRALADEIRADVPSLRHVLVLGEAGAGQVSIPELLGRELAPAEIEQVLTPLRPAAAQVALMLLSGGTTALPKLIARTHDDYVYNFKQAGRIAGLDQGTVILALLPMGHNFMLGSPGVLGALAHGGRVVIPSSRDVELIFQMIERERVTIGLLTPPLAIGWMESPLVDRYDLSSLKNILCGGARMPPELRLKMRQRLGSLFQEGYGNAEGLLSYVRLDDASELQLESSGAPICADDEIKVVDEFDREVADGEAGELLARGPYTIRGYYDNPEANAKAFTEDGFYRTGDIVCKRGRYLYHHGRKKELINRGGEKISCSEVEDHILAYPAIANVVLVAMPDPTYGERACAFVIAKDGSTPSLEELKAFLLTRGIAKFKLPERLELVDSFPISPAGKVLRRRLREMIEQKIEGEKAR